MAVLVTVLGAILLIIGALYIALYVAIWEALSFFLPAGVRGPIAVSILVLATAVVLWRSSAVSTLLGRAVVGRLHDARIRRLGLTRRLVRLVAPVRLAGVGGLKDRFDVSLIDREPEMSIGGVRAGALSVARDRNLYLVMTLDDLELWAHHRLVSFRHILTLTRDHVERMKFVEHDPDRLALRFDHAQRYVGTLDIACSDRHHIFLYIRVKPELGDGA